MEYYKILIINILVALGIYFIGYFLGILYGKKKIISTYLDDAVTVTVSSRTEDSEDSLSDDNIAKIAIYYDEDYFKKEQEILGRYGIDLNGQ